MNDPHSVRLPAIMILVATLLLLVAMATMRTARGWLPTGLMATAILLIVASAAVSGRQAPPTAGIDDSPVPQGALMLVSAMIAVGLLVLALTSRSGTDFIGKARAFLPTIVGLALLSFVIARAASRRAGAYTVHHAVLALGILLAGRSSLPRGTPGGSSAIIGGTLAIGALVAMMVKARAKE